MPDLMQRMLQLAEETGTPLEHASVQSVSIDEK